MPLIHCPACQSPQDEARSICAQCRASLRKITVGYQTEAEMQADQATLESEGWSQASVKQGTSQAPFVVQYRHAAPTFAAYFPGQVQQALGPPPERPAIVVRDYATAAAFNADAPLFVAAGYEVATSTQQEQSVGLASILFLGFWSLLTKPKAHLIVTYQLRSVTPPPSSSAP